jgi:hypothetical protein
VTDNRAPELHNPTLVAIGGAVTATVNADRNWIMSQFAACSGCVECW